MATLTTRLPTLSVARKELEFVVRIDTSDDVEIREGDTFFFKVTNNPDGEGPEATVRVKNAHLIMTHGLTRKWALTLEYV